MINSWKNYIKWWIWYRKVKKMMKKINISISDSNAWYEMHEEGLAPGETVYEELMNG